MENKGFAKNNLGKYLLLSEKEDIFITKNGKIAVVEKLDDEYVKIMYKSSLMWYTT